MHIGHMLQLKMCLLFLLGLSALALVKSDSQIIAAMPSAYAEGTGYVGSYLSEERLHPHAQVHVLRVPTISGQ